MSIVCIRSSVLRSAQSQIQDVLGRRVLDYASEAMKHNELDLHVIHRRDAEEGGGKGEQRTKRQTPVTTPPVSAAQLN